MFVRDTMERLKAWKESNGRKPLFMLGARQVGKTWALKKFGEECFRHCAYFSLDEDSNIRDIFIRSKNPKQIIEQLRFLTEVPIEADETLTNSTRYNHAPKLYLP